MVYVFDLDGTICTKTSDGDYHLAKPYKMMIDIIKRLVEEGHRIIIYTARGMYSKTDRRDFTIKQLNEWGVPYHELHSKPGGDIYIDDLSIQPDEFIKQQLFEIRKLYVGYRGETIE